FLADFVDRHFQIPIVAGACTDVGYLKMAVYEVSEKLEKLTQWTENNVREAIEKALVKVYKAIRAAFDMKDTQRPQLYLMVSVRLDDWRAILIRTGETAVAVINDLDFIGA